MVSRKKEAERYFAESLRAQTAFTPKATPDYRALARERKEQRMWMGFARVMVALMAACLISAELGVVP